MPLSKCLDLSRHPQQNTSTPMARIRSQVHLRRITGSKCLMTGHDVSQLVKANHDSLHGTRKDPSETNGFLA